MRVFKLVLVFVFAGVFSQVNAQDRYLESTEFPDKIVSFIQENFPESKIISIKEEKEHRKTEYEVKLNTMEELEFNQKYAIKSMESKSALPATAIPQKIQDYVAENYPNNEIKEWKIKRRGKQEIELDNDLELQFDLKGNFLRIDD